ncbi:MAG: hypothetical protein H0U45_07910 [Tatlockia sp.]|nr:hypothetical protein [Tatlockia sp.]
MPRPRRSFKDIAQLASTNGYLLVKYWEDGKKLRADIVCSKGHLTTKRLDILSNLCKECKIPHNRLSKESVAERLSNIGYELIGDYSGTNKPITVLCKRGHQTKTWLGKPGCMQCMAVDNSLTFNEVVAIFEIENYKVSPPKYLKSLTKQSFDFDKTKF